MEIAVIGTGYVGLVTGTCLAQCGHNVVCLDTAKEKIHMLRQGVMPIHEPGLEELVIENAAAGRLRFTTRFSAIGTSNVVMLCVGTPQGPTGAADLTALMAALSDIGPHLAYDAVVAIKSTVPVGTNARVQKQLIEVTRRHFEVVSNPEFLRQGSAVYDFMNPDRVVVGARDPLAAQEVRKLYEPVLRHGAPCLVMSPESAEMTKYASNTMLAMKIAFINEIATLCDSVGADVDDVRRAVGTDHRIGMEFLCPGIGYGGSCFPKDVRALMATATEHRHDLTLIGAIDASNENQKLVLARRLQSHFDGDLRARRIGVWGLAFKPNTDDIRESPALVLIRHLLTMGATVHAHDPQAMANTKRVFGESLRYAATPADAIHQAEALAIVTDWDVYRTFPLEDIRQLMAIPTVFDGRNVFDPAQMSHSGIEYYPIGRPPVCNNHNHRPGSGNGKHDPSYPLPLVPHIPSPHPHVDV
jgi:UDPglucose 6-dehydrogenase